MSRKTTSLKLCPGTMLSGYARGSTEVQDLTRQLRALKTVRCDVIGSDPRRPPHCLIRRAPAGAV